MSRKDIWTPMELGILREMFPTRSLADIAKRMKRSEAAIQNKAYKMGLRKDEKTWKTQWPDEKIKLLTMYFPTMFNRPLASWLGVSLRTMLRKARELGLEKQEGFLEKRRKDISLLAAEALRRKENVSSRFKKGVRFNPAGEFKKGHVESPETKAKRSAALKESWKRRKQQSVKYY